MASDGVLDNLFDKDILECVQPQMKERNFANPKAASDCIADKSFKLGNDLSYASPFAVNAREQGINYPQQGKADDIAVITA